VVPVCLRLVKCSVYNQLPNLQSRLPVWQSNYLDFGFTPWWLLTWFEALFLANLIIQVSLSAAPLPLHRFHKYLLCRSVLFNANTCFPQRGMPQTQKHKVWYFTTSKKCPTVLHFIAVQCLFFRFFLIGWFLWKSRKKKFHLIMSDTFGTFLLIPAKSWWNNITYVYLSFLRGNSIMFI